MRRSFRITPTTRDKIVEIVRETPDGAYVEVSQKETRSLAQNARLWPCLEDLSAQLLWRDWQNRPIAMTPDEWKDWLTATFKREQRMMMGEDGASFVLVGSRTSTMSKAEFGEFMDFIEAFAAQRGVKLRIHSEKENL
jgi:hypothetical protein